jgi:hypothetical protein
MSSSSVYPNTLDQVEESITDWFGKLPKTAETPVSFTRTPKASNRLCFVSHAENDLTLEIKDRYVLFQVKSHKLAVYLDNFFVSTAYQDRQVCINFERRPNPEHRFLGSALREVADTKHPVFYSRALRVLKNLEEDLSNTRIEEAASARTDFEVLVDALLASSRLGEEISDDPFASAKLRGLKRKQQMLEQSGGTMTSEQVSELLGISRQAVDKRRSSDQLLALSPGKRGYAYPRFQFDEGKTLQGLEDVLKELRTLDPWMQLIFFTSENERLSGKTPIKALQSGHAKEVLQAARGFGEQGAA